MDIQQIMILVGNGFDMSVLKKYGSGVTTSYSTFYSYYKYRHGENTDNILVKQMEEAQKNKKENWSDFEEILTRNIENISVKDTEQIQRLKDDLNELQCCFSRFLNDVVNNDIIDKLSNATNIKVEITPNCKETYSEQTYTRFLGDLSESEYKRCEFHNRIDNHHKLRYIFINFNYTSLLDNYLYLDKDVFSPRPYKTSDNNICFWTNPKGYQGHSTIDNGYTFGNALCELLPVDIYHPHGVQNVPKSLLFGTESSKCNDVKDERRTFIKSFWARCEERYADKFKTTSLFIIYGCSLGASDSWWWNKIYQRLIENDFAELIIYNFGNEDRSVVINRFIQGCGKQKVDEKEYVAVAKHIFVINFGKQETQDIVFLQLPD